MRVIETVTDFASIAKTLCLVIMKQEMFNKYNRKTSDHLVFFLGLDLTSALLTDPESTAMQDFVCWCFSYWPLSRGETAKGSNLWADILHGNAE